MAIAKITKMRLMGLKAEEPSLLDALQKTGAVQIRICEELDGTVTEADTEDFAVISARKEKTDTALAYIDGVYSEHPATGDVKPVADGFTVDVEEFASVMQKENNLLGIADEIEEKQGIISAGKAHLAEIAALTEEYGRYKAVENKFSDFNDTASLKIYLGTMPHAKTADVSAVIVKNGRTELKVLDNGTAGASDVVCVFAMKDVAEDVYAALTENGFQDCPFKGKNETVRQAVLNLANERKKAENDVYLAVNRIKELAVNVRSLKILSDRYSFELEKNRDDGTFRKTEKTFVMSAFVPEKLKERVEQAVQSVTKKYVLEFSEPNADEVVPTYMDNKKAASQFEFVTNMYSVPKYGGLDPNGVMGFFFSLFMGVITADWGYGILMSLACFIFAKKKSGGLARLAKVLAYGGLFAIPFGILFDSFFGYAIIHKICNVTMGAGNPYEVFYDANLNAISSFSSLKGISIPTLLLWSLLFGCIHIMVGYILKAITEFRRGNVVGALGDGVSWAVFMVGLAVFAFSAIDGVDAVISTPMQTVGLVLLVGALSVAVSMAVVKGKGISRFTNGFVSVYGIINLLSDVLSYARLYGLMLSGAQIASIFTNTLAIEMLFPSGIIGIIFGVIIIVAGNIFNLAMNVLGAYIHDSRLQYVEFFGKFYEGDGELFRPLGSEFTHVTLVRESEKAKA